jgi:hypothetical protein
MMPETGMMRMNKIIGISVLFVCASGIAAAAERREPLDLDKDGRQETVRVFDGNAILREETDTNADGKTDRTLYYRRGFKHLRESDSDQDGQIDRWELYTAKGMRQIARKDTNKDGKFDQSMFLIQSTMVSLREKDRNFDGKVDERGLSRFDYDKTVKMHRYIYDWKEEDSDFDGVIDKYRVRGQKDPKPNKVGTPMDAAFREVEEPRESNPKADGATGVERLLKTREGFENLVAESQDALTGSDKDPGS